MQTVSLGAGKLTIPALGIGTWAWGDNVFWTYGKDYGPKEVKAAFDAAIGAGVTLFDTAEIYGCGESERLLGRFIELLNRKKTVFVATKYFPYPWRFNADAAEKAIANSLSRLQVKCIDLYQIHWPLHFLLQEKVLLQTLAKAVENQQIRTIGVSNYSAPQMESAHKILQRCGIPLVSNQVNYSLLDRKVESNGVLETARKLKIGIIAYSPLAQGLLTGKYSLSSPPQGVRQFIPKFGADGLSRIQPLVKLLQDIGSQRDRSAAQVALNWLICRGTIPIPGAKNAEQAMQNAGALGWELTEAEIAQLDRASRQWL